MDAAAEAQFRDFATGSRRWLLPVAYLLTGDLTRAEELTGRALVRVYRRWHRGVRADGPDRCALRALVTLHASRAREWLARGEQAIDRAAERSARSAGVAGVTPLGAPAAADGRGTEDQRPKLLRAAVQALRPRTRAVLVMGYYTDLPAAEVAELLGCSYELVRWEQAEGLERLAEAVDQPHLPLARPPHPDGDAVGRRG